MIGPEPLLTVLLPDNKISILLCNAFPSLCAICLEPRIMGPIDYELQPAKL